MKTTIPVLICLFFAVARANAEELRTVHIGAILPLSGSSAGEGEMVRRGLELAGKYAKENSPVKIQLHYEDSAGDVKTALSAYRSLKVRHKPSVLVTWGSGIGVALMPLVDQDRVVQLGVATSTPGYRVEGDYSLRLFPSAEREGAYTGDVVARTFAGKQAATLVLNNDYGLGLAATFSRAFESSGRKVVIAETFEASELDFRVQITRLQNRKPGLIYIASYPGVSVAILKQLRKLVPSVPVILSSATVGDPEFLEQSGDASNGALVILPGLDVASNADAVAKVFVRAYSSTYGDQAGPLLLLAARAYDSCLLSVHASKNCPDLTGECLRTRLLEVRHYPGVGGPIDFDSAGDAITGFHLRRIEGGRFVSPDK